MMRYRKLLLTVSRKYHSNIIDHYESPRNIGSLPKKDKDVGTGLVGSPSCGDVVSLSIRVDEHTQKITDAKIKVFGCGSAIASGSYTTEVIKGMNLDEASFVTNKTCSGVFNINVQYKSDIQ